MHDLEPHIWKPRAKAKASCMGEGEFTDEDEVFNEAEVEQLAADLLSTSNEAELDHFIGDLLKKVAHAAGSFIKSPTGKQLGGMLKGLAKQALPVAGAALGNLVVPGAGGALGGKLGSMVGSALGLELEGEDHEFEAAKQFVRLAADAAKSTVGVSDVSKPAAVAHSALTQAAQKFAPGLLQEPGAPAHPHHRHSGRWVRRGKQIILFGV